MTEIASFEAPPPLTDADNVGPLYVDYRTQAGDDALIDQARQRAQALAASNTSREQEPKDTARQTEAAPDGSVAPMTQAEAMGAGGWGKIARFGVAAGKDIGNFVTSPSELPRAAWYGLQKAASALLSLPLEAGAAIDRLELEHGLISEETVRKHQRWIEAIKTAPDADTFLNVKRPETVTGNLVAGAVQFISVAGRAAQVIKAAGVSSAKAVNVGAGFVSAATAFQGSEDTLAEWIQSNPKYANFVTEFLASDPDDSEAEKRLKNGIEAALGGVVFDAFLGGLKMLKAGRAAGMSKAEEGAIPLAPKSELPELSPDHLQRLGEPDAPLVQVVDDTAALGMGTSKATSAKNAEGGGDRTTQSSPGVYDVGPFADGQLRPHTDIEAFVKAEIRPKAEGELIANPTFELRGLSSRAFDKLVEHAPAFSTLPNRIFISGRALEAFEKLYPRSDTKVDEFLNSALSAPQFVVPNTRGDAWARPILVAKLREFAQVVLNPREDGAGIDVTSVTRIKRTRVNELKEKAEEQGLEVDDLSTTARDAQMGTSAPSASLQPVPPILKLDQSIPALKEELGASYAKLAKSYAETAEAYKQGRKPDARTAIGDPNLMQPIILGPVTPEGVARINAIFAKEGIDIDVTGYLNEVDAYAARHTIKGHGSKMAEAARGQLPVTARDWALIPDILAAPDHIAYLGRAKSGGEIIAVGKQVNGHVLYLAVARTGRRTLAAHTMEKFPGRVEDIAARVEVLRKAQGSQGEGMLARQPSLLRPSHDPGTTNIGNIRTDINWTKIETSDDIQSALKDLADAFPDDVPSSLRGVASEEATQAAADVLGMSVDDVMKQRNGVDFTPEQVQAASRLLTASQEKLIEVARAASQHGAPAADQYAFRRMLATQYAIQAEVLGAGSKTATALDTWLLPAGTGPKQMRALEQRLLGSGGSEVSEALARRLSVLALAGVDPKVMNRLIRRAASANTMDAVRQIYVDGLLSNPLPHVASTAGGIFVAMQQIVERGVAGKIARATGSGGVAEGEATAMIYGLLSGQWDALRLASRTMMGKATKPTSWQPGKPDGPRFDLEQAGGPGRVVDYLGKVFGVGPKLLDGTDVYFKAIGYRMELHAQAFRQARSEGLEGAALDQRVAAIVADPPPNIRLAAADAALYNTFSNPNGAFGQALLKMRNGGGALNPLPFVLPFVRTPVNVARYTFERTPLAPLVGQWRADIAAGGARRDLALARMAVGSTALAVAADLAMQGKVSGEGPKDPAERGRLMKTGWQPHAVEIGGTWHAYNSSDPLGQTLAFAADLTDALNSGDVDPDHVAQWDEVTAGGIAALAQFAGNKTYLQGLADFAQAMADPQRGGSLDRLGSSLLSTGGEEPAASPLAAIAARIPSLTAQLTPRRDLWGDPDDAAERDAPIDRELLRLGIYPPAIRKKTSFQNAPVNFRDWPEVYDEYLRLAGNGLKSALYDGLGAKDLLNEVVSGGNRWSEIYAKGSDGPDGTKARFIQSIVRQYRTAAQDQIMRDPKFKDFARTVRRMQASKEAVPAR